MNNFSVGDEVIFVRGGVYGNESREWWRDAGLQVGKKYVVVDISKDDVSIRVKDHPYVHHHEHFDPAHIKIKQVPIHEIKPYTIVSFKEEDKLYMKKDGNNVVSLDGNTVMRLNKDVLVYELPTTIQEIEKWLKNLIDIS